MPEFDFALIVLQVPIGCLILNQRNRHESMSRLAHSLILILGYNRDTADSYLSESVVE